MPKWRSSSEHPVSYSLEIAELERLKNDYQARGAEFLINLNIEWDLETDFGEYHDVTPEDLAAGLSAMNLTKAQIANSVYGGKTHKVERFWDFGTALKLTGVIFDVLEEKPLTPPLLNADEKCGCLFLNSGCHRFALGAINHAEPLPVLIRAKQRAIFEKIISI